MELNSNSMYKYTCYMTLIDRHLDLKPK